MQNFCLFYIIEHIFSILHIHFYKTPISIYVFYHLFYLNNNISLILYYILQTTTHRTPPTFFFLFLMPISLFLWTISFSLVFLFLPSSLYSFFFFNRFLKFKPTSPSPSSHSRHHHVATNNPSQPQLQRPTTATSNLDVVLHCPHLTSSWFWLILEFDFIWFLLVLWWVIASFSFWVFVLWWVITNFNFWFFFVFGWYHLDLWLRLSRGGFVILLLEEDRDRWLRVGYGWFCGFVVRRRQRRIAWWRGRQKKKNKKIICTWTITVHI